MPRYQGSGRWGDRQIRVTRTEGRPYTAPLFPAALQRSPLPCVTLVLSFPLPPYPFFPPAASHGRYQSHLPCKMSPARPRQCTAIYTGRGGAGMLVAGARREGCRPELAKLDGRPRRWLAVCSPGTQTQHHTVINASWCRNDWTHHIQSFFSPLKNRSAP